MSDRAVFVTIDAVTYRCVQLYTSFRLRGVFYPSGSWLIQSDAMPYAEPMTSEAFMAWKDL